MRGTHGETEPTACDLTFLLNKNLVNQDPKGQAPSTTPRTLCAQELKNSGAIAARETRSSASSANLLSSPIEKRMTKGLLRVQLFHNYHPFTDHQALRDDYGYHSSRFRQRTSSKRDGRVVMALVARKRLADPPVIVDTRPLPAKGDPHYHRIEAP